MKLINEITEFANQNPVCFMATIDKVSPRVRGLLLWFADETGFYFWTDVSKDLFRQLKANPRVEICFYMKGKTFAGTRTLRISGKAEFIDDGDLLSRLYEQRGYLKKMARSVVVFRISSGKAVLWTGSDAAGRPGPVSFRCGKSKRSMDQRDACLTFSSGKKYHHLKYESIVFLSSHGKRTVIHSREGDFQVPVLFKDIIKKLPDGIFCRIHRQFIVNRNFIARLNHESGGRYSVLLSDDDDSLLPVGRVHAMKLRIALGSGTFIP
ncbi:MAG: LytTR family transcriptional regulator DNA-binding domain-containing protein [Spirochaetes bacterium]|jgi:uncharacterized pyridoxamine 5'-phosphate oxidase family protein|nr:LytTR family transcriptional regulator DNA-binding domain-containing protein [Spirochaetota bacterium]